MNPHWSGIMVTTSPATTSVLLGNLCFILAFFQSLPPICLERCIAAVAAIYRTLYSAADVTPISNSVAWAVNIGAEAGIVAPVCKIVMRS